MIDTGLKLECLRLAIKSLGGYKMDDNNVSITNKNCELEKVIEVAEAYYQFIIKGVNIN